MISLNEDDLFVSEPHRPCVWQSRSQGRKLSSVVWAEGAGGSHASLAAAGSWDEGERAHLALWSVDIDANDGPQASRLVEVEHKGCVLSLAAAAPLLASGGSLGDLCCFSLVGELPELRPCWSKPVGTGAAVLGVGFSPNGHSLAYCTERAELGVLDRGGVGERQLGCSDESSLFSVEWLSPHEIVTAGANVLIWDVRTGRGPAATLLPKSGIPRHSAPQLLSATAHPQQPHRLAAGATDGSLYLWDRRAAASLSHSLAAHTAFTAHEADVWQVRFVRTNHGEILSCSSDGTLTAREAPAASAEPMDASTLISLEFPINAFDVSPTHGGLAAASDAEVLTFIDMRAS